MRITRREMLSLGAGIVGGSAALLLNNNMRAASDGPFPIVDCHTHFYDPSRPEGAPWPSKDNSALYRSVLPKDFLEQAAPLGVTNAVVIEASPRVEDNAWLLGLAANNSAILGVVGNLSPGTPGFADNFKRFAADKKFRGIRIGHKALQPGLEQDGFLADVRRLGELGLELDVNGGPEMPDDVARLAEKIPELTIVINHLANVAVNGAAPPREWLAGMRAAARHPRVFCKVSSLVEHAKRASSDGTVTSDVEFYRPVLDAAWDAFGDDRLIYGSNWPVSDRAAPYRTVFSIVNQYVANRGRSATEKFFLTNAQAAYRWPA